MKIINPLVWFKEAEGTAEKLFRFSLILAGFATVLLFFGILLGSFIQYSILLGMIGAVLYIPAVVLFLLSEVMRTEAHGV
ncbi:MAG: hypothetical protein HY362_04730 [Candidatus Aenigmarchaeota archaeon]|nr:hypothetical protein [Candidatus Aenigmarchaeota archaeon]